MKFTISLNVVTPARYEIYHSLNGVTPDRAAARAGTGRHDEYQNYFTRPPLPVLDIYENKQCKWHDILIAHHVIY